MALYRRAIIQGLITAPLAAYLLPGDSLFKPLPNDLGNFTCSTSQGCEAPADVRGVGPHAGTPGPAKGKVRGTESSYNSYQCITHSHFPDICFFFLCRCRSQAQYAGWILQEEWSSFSAPQTSSVWQIWFSLGNNEMITCHITLWETSNFKWSLQKVKRCNFFRERSKCPVYFQKWSAGTLWYILHL